ncbi:MAG: hypothetical protein WCF12_02125 [Propionicimonas sp.]
MGLWLRRLLACGAVSIAFALTPLVPALAETVSPSPVATATPTTSASPSPSATAAAEGEVADSPDVALDDTRTALVIAGAALVAVVAAIVVFLRR